MPTSQRSTDIVRTAKPAHTVNRRVRKLVRTGKAAAPAALPLLGLMLALALSGCGTFGTDSGSTADAQQTAEQQQKGQQGQRGPGGANFPGAIGEIADVSGRTLQVQGNDSQVAVTYSDKTAITNTVDGTAADLKVGVCVTVQSRAQASAQPGAGGQDAAASKVTATRVTISQPTKNGTCAGGFGASGGLGRNGPPNGRRPTAPPGGRIPTPGADGRFGGFTPANGLVTATDGATFVVKATVPAGTGGRAGKPAPTPTMTTRKVTVTTTAKTAWAKEVADDGDALVVGACATALGKADDTGTISATSISVRPKQAGSCSQFGAPTGRGGAADG